MMLEHRLLVALIACLPALAQPALADSRKPVEEIIPPGAMYRYYNEHGRLVIRSTLPKEAIYIGYDIVDASGQLIKHVEKAMPEEERLKQLEKLRAAERDQNLTKLYPTPDDAARARDRQISAIQLKITYAQNSISQLNTKLNDEVSSAANYEKAGNEIPENTRKSIDLLSRQIRDEEAKIAKYEGDIAKTSQEFDDIIKRLEELTSGN